MGLTFPYTYISCPCSDGSKEIEESRLRPAPLFHKKPLAEEPEEVEEEKEEAPFDPHHPRASFSLFPPEHLLYCEECRDLKCPRCSIEEQVSYFCTSCLFETPASAVRSEGNRCARNCFNCPICFSQLSVNNINGAVKEGPWILNCYYCMWTSLDIGIRFDRPTNIRAQLDRIANGGTPKAPSKPTETPDLARRSSYLNHESYPQLSATTNEPPPIQQDGSPKEAPLDPAARFTALKAFYKNQLTTTTAANPTHPSISSDFSYSSPSSLNRILNLYSTSGTFPPKKKPKPQLMREALYPSEGLLIPSPDAATSAQTKLLSSATGGFINTTTLSQRHFQTGPAGGNPDARFVDELRPMPAPLTTKRAKRCKECRHILVKPEAKPTSTRHRIKLVALSYIPHVSLRPLLGTSAAGGGASTSSAPSALLYGGDVILEPGKPTQWILKLTNSLFDAVRVSIATPAVTPGKYGHRVTILCPQFEIGANSDVWEEALGSKSGDAAGSAGKISGSGNGGVAEAGKVYEKGRNWTSVVVEVVPVSIAQSIVETADKEEIQVREVDEDEDVLEIPIRVRLDWKQGDLDDGANKKARLNEEGVEDGVRELAYWVVLGVGRVKK
ncbi:hypothetical protein EPUS_04962 [Endocarpon pusillum Z07020]|uniref:Dynactin subunit 4 n=1 Tax=Endocarpon pusillum (strain Z07020 / HMAS-L-300199) TaxID=1263415 RepID=U1HS95_ENDPU|nr:uncharacterized protein EPUS_04962 [Endocarpon pusillum Z07020]ERF72044.1 hypothetical protein EPUS_04962 [Endocarpon pusillum Z07020]